MAHLDHVSSSALANLTDIAIVRPTRGAGGDITGRETQASALKGYYESTSAQFTNAQGVLRSVTGQFFVDPIDGNGVAVDVQDGDYITHTDFRGLATPEREIVRVSPWYCGTTLHHLVLEVGS